MAKKRERLEIIKDILRAIMNKRSLKPTRLLYASNLSPQMFKDYVGELLSKGLIKEELIKKQKYFMLTKKGTEFIEQYKVIENFVQNFGL
jgi:predicted transcriptional regulator